MFVFFKCGGEFRAFELFGQVIERIVDDKTELQGFADDFEFGVVRVGKHICAEDLFRRRRFEYLDGRNDVGGLQWAVWKVR